MLHLYLVHQLGSTAFMVVLHECKKEAYKTAYKYNTRPERLAWLPWVVTSFTYYLADKEDEGKLRCQISQNV